MFFNTSDKLTVLLDPDKIRNEEHVKDIVHELHLSGCKLILVGSSLLLHQTTESLISLLKKHTEIPIYLFPGNGMQLCNNADGILLLSLLSGRNPDYLIGQHVQVAGQLHKSNLDIIPTAYLLIENGSLTSVEYISNTKPLPRNKPDLILATALAAQQLGFKCIYLEAGSGAKSSVPTEIITLLKKELSIPVIVGGGIRSKEQYNQILESGADKIVIGTAFEKNLSFFRDKECKLS